MDFGMYERLRRSVTALTEIVPRLPDTSTLDATARTCKTGNSDSGFLSRPRYHCRLSKTLPRTALSSTTVPGSPCDTRTFPSAAPPQYPGSKLDSAARSSRHALHSDSSDGLMMAPIGKVWPRSLP